MANNLAALVRLARQLDTEAAHLPDAPTHKQHLSIVRRAHGRGGWDAVEAAVAPLVVDYRNRQTARLAALHAHLSAPLVPKDAAPMLFAPEPPTTPSLAVRLMRWLRRPFVQHVTA